MEGGDRLPEPGGNRPAGCRFPGWQDSAHPAGPGSPASLRRLADLPQNPWFAARRRESRLVASSWGGELSTRRTIFGQTTHPWNPALLSYLEKEFVASKYDLRHLYRLIVNSRTYQQSPIPRSKQPEAHAYFACLPGAPSRRGGAD